MDMKIVWFCALVLSLDIVESQYSNSPCPNFFDFESDGSQIYGRIILRGSVPVPSLVLRINFTVAAQLYNKGGPEAEAQKNYVGRLEAENSNSLLQMYNNGLPVRYRVHFPVTRPLPKLTALTVNGETVCYGPGDIPRPNSYVTTLSLQHTSFLQGGGPLRPGGPVYNNYQPPRRPDPVEVTQFGDDAQVFTFNNIEPGWNNGNSPYYVVNNTQPVYQQPTQVYQPSRPIYEQDEPGPPLQEEIPQYRPQKPAKPVYQPVTKRPVYQAPVTRPPPPPKQETFYYPEPQTEAPRPVTQSPVNRKPDSQTSSIPECGTIAGGNERVPLIFHGKGYPRGDLPWLVAIYKSDGGTLGFTCGGTLVSNRHVITAAHCVYNRETKVPIKDFVVKVGVHNLNDWGDDITVTRTLIAADIHETYNASTLENDIVIFTFNKRVTFNTYIRPACLWSGSIDQNLIKGAIGVVAGWGDQSGPKQGEPQMVHLPVVSTDVCRASKPDFHLLTSETTLCAGDRSGAGPCRGDSGGGLYLLDGGRWRLRGVVSVSLRATNSESVCNLNEYLIFTDTAQYLPWIRRVMSENYFD
ncbi:serine protease gd-like isoform X1 [Trichoplusia ni]|uniref:Serine protease gd-like isoform X1 n=1 Tax=Trichoplusia ni TaxID=7111 RepID=A0A7E5VGL6_TRINI|nr:serine protease gd-like isoform X1 [Trichoplusia ni]